MESETEPLPIDDALLRWFEQAHLLRTQIVAEDEEHISEIVRPPLVLLSSRDDDVC